MAGEAGNNDEHTARVSRFKQDLGKEAEAVEGVIRKYITTGEPVMLDPSAYHELRVEASREFQIHPTAVIVVGSCRLGFTLKQKGRPAARYTAAQPGSDVDVAIISEKLFDEYWDDIFGIIGPNRNWALAHGRRFARDLFCGWMTPNDLPNTPRLAAARKWAEFFDGLTRKRIFGIRKISGRLYRNWARLESYQSIMIDECRSELINFSNQNETSE